MWQLNQKQLNRILFPLADLTKKEVRVLAEKFKLPVLNIKESQEICFVPNSLSEFLSKNLKTRPGPIIEQKTKKIIGQHKGLPFYTIGQRKGIEIVSTANPAFVRQRRTTAGKPFYVSEKDLKKNSLIITQDENDLMRKELIAKDVNWVSVKPPKFPLKIMAKIRYGFLHKAVPAILYNIKRTKKVRVVFLKRQRAITPGQSVVFYSPAEVSTKAGKSQEPLGGGVIV